MKKLMVAAAIAASAIAANAACSLPGGANATPVWDFQMMLRADTRCVTLGDVAAAQHCGLAAGTCGCYRELQTLTYSGVWYICEGTCADIATGITVDVADMTRRIKYCDGVVAALPPSGDVRVATPITAWTELYRVGAYAGTMAGIVDLTLGGATLQLAGFGAFPLNADVFQTFSGFATGLVPAAPSCADSQTGGAFCGIYPICNPGVVASDANTWAAPDETKAKAVAYGQFQVKYNAAASARLAASKGYDPGNPADYDARTILPAWFYQ